MAQLIIVIISIAVTAAMGLMGTYYVAGPFMDAKDRAVAVQYVAQAAQIATAWKAWSKAHGTKILTQVDWGNGSTDLVPNYLSAIPSLQTSVFGIMQWLPIVKENFACSGAASTYTCGANSNALAAFLPQTKQGNNICKQIALLSQNNLPLNLATSGNNATPRNNALFDCVYMDVNGNGFDVADYRAVIYRVF